jgi:hypothetical protein
MNGENSERQRPRPTGSQQGEGDPEGTPPRVIMVFAIAIAVILVGGYLLVMKLIAMSRQEDCLLSGRRNCVPIEVPTER